ncbi:MAG: cupin domain-containing protein [Solirubrobacterales bacterium]|nr:cupin domain-containing protein [Solirubrobacterales bacterium]
MGIAHFDEAPTREFALGHIRGRWSALGDAAGSRRVGVRRIEIPAGGWSTPAHEHGLDEELFYVLEGRGLSWQNGRTAEVRAGDCILYAPRRGAHTLHALEPLDVLAFGPRHSDESPRFPRLGLSLVGNRAVESSPGSRDGIPVQFIREAELGPPELSEPGERPSTIVSAGDVDAERFGLGRVSAQIRDLGRATGSVGTGLNLVEVEAGRWGTPLHCHSVEEELFVVLAGEGVVVLGDEEIPVRRGSVVARPPGTGVAHALRAGDPGLTYLAYGTREPADMCFYPRSNKIAFRGLGVIGRIEPLDYWDGED